MISATPLDLDGWAARIPARSLLPVLMRRLVCSRPAELTLVDFPAHESTNEGGWDGQTVAKGSDPWIPTGQGFWELSCQDKSGLATKASGDFKKRTDKTEEAVREASAFVFVTPRKWSGKQKWRKQRLAEGSWADVRVYDADDLSAWLEQAPAAQAFMASQLGRPIDDVCAPEDLWDEWAGVTKPELTFAVFAQALDENRTLLDPFFGQGTQRLLHVAGETREEAAAFIAGAVLFGDLGGTVAQRVLVARTTAGLQWLKTQEGQVTVIVGSRDVEAALGKAANRFHVIVPTDRATLEDRSVPTIEPLTWDAFRAVAEALDLDDHAREVLEQESGRRITLMRRRLAQVASVRSPAWAGDPQVVRPLVALALAGGWVWSRDADRALIARLASATEEEVEVAVQALAALPDTPIYVVGDVGGIVSRADAFSALRGRVTKTDLARLFDGARELLAEPDNSLELPEDQRWMGNALGKERKFSGTLRRNLLDTIAFLSVNAKGLLGNGVAFDCPAAASKLTRDMLSSGPDAWLHVRDALQSLAEAAPDAFLSMIERDLPHEAEDQGVWRLVKQVVGHHGENYCVSLLWALERLAWAPEYFPRVVNVLAALSTRTMDDNHLNKPSNTLYTCFHPWLAQTGAPISLRQSSFKTLTAKYRAPMWDLALTIIDQRLGHGSYANRPRYRADATGHGFNRDSDDRKIMQDAANVLLESEPLSVAQIHQLVEKHSCFSPEDSKRLWARVEEWSQDAPPEDTAAVRETIRRTALGRRARKKGKAPAVDAVALFEKLKPADPVHAHAWLFRDSWVEFGADELEDEDTDKFDYHAREKRIADARVRAILEIWTDGGLAGLASFAARVGNPWIVGEHATSTLSDFNAVEAVALFADADSLVCQNRDGFFSGILFRLPAEKRSHLLKELVLRWRGSAELQVDLLCLAPADPTTWEVVDGLPGPGRSGYWRKVKYGAMRDDGPALERLCRELVTVNRPNMAFRASQFEGKLLSTKLLLDILNGVAFAQNPPEERGTIDRHWISEFFTILDEREDCPKAERLGLEWVYAQALDRHHGKRGLRDLSESIATDPALFIQGVKAFWRRTDDGKADPEEPEISPERKKQNAEIWWHVLQHITRPPGSDEAGTIDPERFDAWMEEAKGQLVDCGRLTSGDYTVGEIVGRTRLEVEGVWPPEPVARALEKWASEEFCRGLYIGVVNSRGVHWRNPAGGKSERSLAEKFRSWGRRIAVDCPRLAAALECIAKSYDSDAEREDEWAELERVAPA